MEIIFTKYLYFFSSITCLIITITVWLFRKDLRNRIVFMGLLFGVFGFFLEFYFFKDYWTPPLLFKIGQFGGLEDFFFGFSAGAVGTSIYSLLNPKKKLDLVNKVQSAVPIMILIQILSLEVFTKKYEINSIYASSIGFALCGFVFLCLRKDLLLNAVITAFIGAIILILGELLFLESSTNYLQSYFLINEKTLYVLGIAPVTELIWGLSFGFMTGILYEIQNGVRYKS